MPVKIAKKIKGYQVVHQDAAPAPVPEIAPATVPAESTAPAPAAPPAIVQMHEKLERPEVLVGTTYKVKSPLFEHAIYVTLNDVVLNAGTEYEVRRPFEVFINSKNMDHFQWIVALTRIMSAVFRKGGDCTFLVEELRAVFDPRGGYWKPGGIYMPSLVAELGSIVERHLKTIGLIDDPELSEAQRKLIAEKRAAYERVQAAKTVAPTATEPAANVTPENRAAAEPAESSFPPGATLCSKCNVVAAVMLDGCSVCLNCSYSKCG